MASERSGRYDGDLCQSGCNLWRNFVTAAQYSFNILLAVDQEIGKIISVSRNLSSSFCFTPPEGRFIIIMQELKDRFNHINIVKRETPLLIRIY